MPNLNAGSRATVFSSATCGAVSAPYNLGTTVQTLTAYMMTTNPENSAHVTFETASSNSYPGIWFPIGGVSGQCFQPIGITYLSFFTGTLASVRGTVVQSDQSVTVVLLAR